MLGSSFKAATKLIRESPTRITMETVPVMELYSSLPEDIHVKIRETSQNTDLDIQELLMIDKLLQFIQGELVKNNSKLTKIDKCINKIAKSKKKLEMILFY